MAVAPDGSVVVAGATTMGGNAVVLRLTPSGAPDPSFGPGGVRVFDFGGADAAHAVAIQPDGRIVIAGTGAAGRAILVTRLFPDGTPDPSFDGDGTAGIDLAPGEDVAFAIAVQPDGRIVTAGATGSPSNAVFVRMARTGAIDRTFGLAGVRVVDAGGADVVRALALRPDGRIVAAGVGGRRREAAVWRLDADGSLDGSFGRRGAAGFTAGDRTSSADAVALQPNGKVVVAGAIGRDMLVGRFQPGGATDLTWGRDGRRVVQLGGRDAGSAVAVQRDGAIVAAGQTSAGDGDVAVVRLDGDPPRPAPLCRSREATIVGTPGDDVLVGTPRRDVIVALAGDDRVQARGGGDIVCGGAGRDRLFGGPGDDVLLGQAGPDVMDGGDDADLLRGGGGRDVCTGGPGRDAYACERITGRSGRRRADQHLVAVRVQDPGDPLAPRLVGRLLQHGDVHAAQPRDRRVAVVRVDPERHPAPVRRRERLGVEPDAEVRGAQLEADVHRLAVLGEAVGDPGAEPVPVEAERPLDVGRREDRVERPEHRPILARHGARAGPPWSCRR